MRVIRTVLTALLGTFICGVALLADEAATRARQSLIGEWTGTDPGGLTCITVFEESKGKVMTFKDNRHMSTVNFWWNLSGTGRTVVLGVSGEAEILENGELLLKLRPRAPNLTTVSDVVLKQRVATLKPPPNVKMRDPVTIPESTHCGHIPKPTCWSRPSG